MKKIPFKFNGTIIFFFVLGFLLLGMSLLFANDLWFGSVASWNLMNFLLMFFFGTFALIFIGLAVGVGWYAAKPYVSRPMPAVSKVVTIGLLIIVGLLGWFVGVFYLSKYIDKQVYLARTAETPAEIISESSYSSGSGKHTTTTYTVKYSYTVDGRAYQAVSDSFKPLNKGGAVKACYNPANPNSSQIRNADFQCAKEEWYE